MKSSWKTKGWICKFITFIITFPLCFFISISGIFLSYETTLANTSISDTSTNLSTSLDRSFSQVGSIVTLTMTYRLPEGARIPRKPEIKGLEDVTIIDQDIKPHSIHIRLLIDTLESWQTGELKLKYLDQHNQTGILKANPVSLKVLSNLGEKPAEAKLKTIQDILPTRFTWRRYLFWPSVFIGTILVFTFLFLVFRKNRIKQNLAEKSGTPHMCAIKSIQELVDKKLFEQGHVKEFYFRFTEILRQYLESLRGFPAVKYTTEEIAHCITEERDYAILSLLLKADLVKFADAIPTTVQKEEDVISALSYIRETISSEEHSELKNSDGGKIP